MAPQIDTSLPEHTLVERLCARDQSAVYDLAVRYSPRIRQLALRCVRNEEDADEVVQDVLLKVCQKIEAFRGDSALSSWIYRITFNTAMSRLRSSRAARRDPLAPSEAGDVESSLSGADVPDPSSSADLEILRRELRQQVVKALADLPPIYRQPVLLRDVHGLTTEEASTLLRVKGETLKSRLHRGRLMLRGRLSAFADGLGLHRSPAQVYN